MKRLHAAGICDCCDAPELHECPYCDGRGWNTIAVHDPTDPDGEPLPAQEQCATCGGSGEVSSPATNASEPVEATQGPSTDGNPSSHPGSEASDPATKPKEDA